MVVMRKTSFLNDEENKDVLDFMNELIAKDKGETAFIESGDIRVEVESRPSKSNKDERWLFSIYRRIGHIERDQK